MAPHRFEPLTEVSDEVLENQQIVADDLIEECDHKVIDLANSFRQAAFSLKAEQKRSVEQQPSKSFASFYHKYTVGLLRVLAAMDVAEVEALAYELAIARENNRQIFIIGNGGSGANASHMANDFSKDRFGDERFLFRVISLSDNTATISATGNDFGYEYIFVNQLKNLLQPKDLVLAISSSGNSPNIVKAIEYANKKGATSVAVVGFTGGKAAQLAAKKVYIPTEVGQYGFMEDVTLVLGHILSIYFEEQDRTRQGLSRA